MTALYKMSAWDNYAVAHLSVLTSVQLEVYKAVALNMRGKVADFGCGTARIAPFLVDRGEVTAYTGIDYSADMVEQARWLISQLQANTFRILHSSIEGVENHANVFDSALSVNSYYTWGEPEAVLAHINGMLRPGAPFILVTPNQKLDMRKLLREADRELLSHPHYPAFREQNMALAGNEQAAFVDMDVIVRQLAATGFKLVACHQDFYLGGLNFIHAQKA